MNILDLARAEIRALQPYSAAQQVADTIRLNANESPQIGGVGTFRRPLNRYPDIYPQHLRKMLARRFSCAAEQLLVTRGSSEAIDLLIRSFCCAGKDSILTPSPSFSMFRHYAEIQGARVIEVATLADADFAIDVNALLQACDDSTHLVFVCSPNNPTGTPLPRTSLESLLSARQDSSIVVVDEAYVEFGSERSAVELLGDNPNLVVLRTLSKALGLAGARCGAVIASTEIIHMLSAVQAPYAMATPVVECVEDALQDAQLDLAAQAIAEIVAQRLRLQEALPNYKFVRKVWPSDANFLLLRVDNADRVMRHCTERHILLRQFGAQLVDCIRITVGSRSDNDALLQAFDALQET
jgi:histidinol-phosphate aminotransferase